MARITFPDIADQKLGVDEPILLMAHTDTGEKIIYSITAGSTRVDLVDGSELRPKATGLVTVKAEIENSNPIVSEENKFTITDGGYYKRLAAIDILKRKLDNDGLDLLEISKLPVTDIQELRITGFQDSAIVSINNTEYKIDSLRHVQKYLQKATEIWRTERTNDEARLDQMIAQLKSIDPS